MATASPKVDQASLKEGEVQACIETPAGPWRELVAAGSGLASAWIAAGSTGLLGHPLRHALTWTAMGIVVVASWPCLPTAGPRLMGEWRKLLALAVGVLIAFTMSTSMLPAVNVLGVAVLLAVVSGRASEPKRHVLLSTAVAVVVLAVYRTACTSIPAMWLVMDSLAGLLGRLAGRITGRPLWVGPTMAGVDFLVTMAALWVFSVRQVVPAAVQAGRPHHNRGPKRLWTWAVWAAVAIVSGHLVYLGALSFVPEVLAWLGSPTGAGTPEISKAWSWTAAIRTLIPWNLPVVAGIMHLLIATVMLRSLVGIPSSPNEPAPSARGGRMARFRRMGSIATVGLAVVFPLVTTLNTQKLDLRGKKIVAYKEGFLNWLKPEHGEYGRLSVGMYGMLPSFVACMGGTLAISPDLSEQDLGDADVLILLYPNKPWKPGELERIWDFVGRGGSLLVMGDHTVLEKDVSPAAGGNHFNEVLQPTAMRVRFDSAMFEVGGWLQTYEALAHPTTAGIADDRNQFGVVIGASVETGWPARPILVGRYGWADPGDEGSDAAMMGNHRYDAGEKLGDLVLAAEQNLGKGKVIVFGDTSSLTNGITVGAHEFTSRLLGYLAGHHGSIPQVWRQGLALLGALALMVLLGQGVGGRKTARQPGFVWRLRRGRQGSEAEAGRPQTKNGKWLVGLTSLGLAVSLVWCTRATHRANEILPDGRLTSPNNLAYIDASHLPAYSEESWREDGVGGLALTLMRNGYLALNLYEFTPERLERAGLLVCVAPAREYSPKERQAVRAWVENGGMLICTVGYEAREASRSLLGKFGLYVGDSPPGQGGQARPPRQAHEPAPLGHFKSTYLEAKGYRAHVRFHAAWPVGCTDPESQVMAYGVDTSEQPAKEVPVMLLRRVGQGKVVLVGDTCFAMNKNLEHEGGEPFEGMRENADFWRWLIAYLTNRPEWLPQAPGTQPAEK